jgi:rhodanese-related sulfurtransferase
MAKKKKTKSNPNQKAKQAMQPAQKSSVTQGQRNRSRAARQAARRQRASRTKTFYGIAGVVLIGLMALIIYRIQDLAAQPAAASLPAEITVQEAYQKYEQGAFLLDVREPDEWEDYHVPNTTLIPLSQLQGRVSELPRDQEVVVICRSGNRSQEGRDILLQAGFENVTSMTGGVIDWRVAGYPIEAGSP